MNGQAPKNILKNKKIRKKTDFFFFSSFSPPFFGVGWGGYPFISYPQKWSKNILKISFFHNFLSYPTPFKGLIAQRGL